MPAEYGSPSGTVLPASRRAARATALARRNATALKNPPGIQDIYVLYAGAAVFAVCLVLAFLAATGHFAFEFRPGEDPAGSVDHINAAIDFGVIGTLVLLLPYGILATRRASRIAAIEARLPDFLRDVAEAGRFGMTLPEAIIVASKGRYGPLTEEIQHMASQLEWGVPVAQALRLFEDRIQTPLTSRVVSIIVKANEAGGNVADVLNMVAHDTREVQLSEEQRKITMVTYLTVIYISFGVFLATILIMAFTFLPQMVIAAQGLSNAGVGGTGGAVGVSAQYIPAVFLAFLAAVIAHAVGDGMMAGVIHSGKLQEGMIHGGLMLIVGWVFMRFLVPISV